MVLNGNRKLPRLLYEIQDANKAGAADKVNGATRSRSRTAPDIMAPTLPLRCHPLNPTAHLRTGSTAPGAGATTAPSHCSLTPPGLEDCWSRCGCPNANPDVRSYKKKGKVAPGVKKGKRAGPAGGSAARSPQLSPSLKVGLKRSAPDSPTSTSKRGRPNPKSPGGGRSRGGTPDRFQDPPAGGKSSGGAKGKGRKGERIDSFAMPTPARRKPSRSQPGEEVDSEESDVERPPGSPRRRRRGAALDEEERSRLVVPADLTIPYTMDKVPQVVMDKKRGTMVGSVMYRPVNRHEWYATTGEMYALCAEAARRRGVKLDREPSAPLPAAYLTDRIDIDDPLRGYQVREAENGWMQGLLTHTTFTHWTRYFKWDSLHPASGVKEAGTMVNNEEFLDLHRAEEDETPSEIAENHGVELKDLLEANAGRYVGLKGQARLKAGTTILLPPKDRSKKEEAKLLKARKVDLQGTLAKQLQACKCTGNPEAEGVVTPRIAEVGLVGGLGCGSWLLTLALEELAKEYDFAVLQATLGSVTFYEQFGFQRIGAIAKYAEKGVDIKDADVVGYRHWTFKDEKKLEAHGAPSYMMALKLQRKDTGIMAARDKLIVDSPPPLVPMVMPKKKTPKKSHKAKSHKRQQPYLDDGGARERALSSMGSRLGGSSNRGGGNLFNKIVKVSGDKEASRRGSKYWFVLQYERERGVCHLCPLRNSGVFRGRGSRNGQVRWKTDPEAKEIKVKAPCCTIMVAEAINQTTDVDKETWDVIDDADGPFYDADGEEVFILSPQAKGATGGKRSRGAHLLPDSPATKRSKHSKPVPLAVSHRELSRLGASPRTATPKGKGKTRASAGFLVRLGNTHRVLHRKKVQTELGDTVMHKWVAFVEEDEDNESEEKIAKVSFHLHPSFKPAVVTVEKPNKHGAFECKQQGWGVFDIKCEIFLKNGTAHTQWLPLSFVEPVNAQTVELK